MDKHTGASTYDFMILKDFMKIVAFDIDEAEDNSNPGEATVIVC